ncbi:hypothetical protein ACFO3J_16680 [Streptomyces polygonati]|uniref:DUF3558 domain-containing protein n=1 Tax=Streptomyces polygonati TaxID=1617087 RepID=A0ABV8HMF2_9ACTN
MITEPEMWDEPGAVGPGGPLGGSEHPLPIEGLAGGFTERRPWWWALGGVLGASAVWAAVLHGTGYGHRPAPDLHGYHLIDSPCGGFNLKALTDAVHSTSYQASPTDLRRGPALDSAACTLTTVASAGNGWTSTYTVTVGVELHKKTDPRVEFEDRNHLESASLSAEEPGTLVVGTSPPDKVTSVAGLGDSAYLLTAGNSDQTLTVLHGGAVFSLQLSRYSNWNGPGIPPTDAELFRPTPVDLGPALRAAMRHLMGVLSS